MRIAALLLTGVLTGPLAQAADPLVIAHRGASGYLPEHTLAGYELAVKLGADDKVFIQSFSDATVKSLAAKQRRLGLKIPLILLGQAALQPDGTAMLAVSGGRTLPLPDVAAFASGVGVAISNTKFPLTKGFVDQAHAAGLAVHGWTFAKPDPTAAAIECQAFLEMGLDGLFSNYSDLAVKARNAFTAARR